MSGGDLRLPPFAVMRSSRERFTYKEGTTGGVLGPGSYNSTLSIFDLQKAKPHTTSATPAFGSKKPRFNLGRGY